MSLGKNLERFAKALTLVPRSLIHYGRLRPSRVRLVDCEHWVHIDPTDRRAVKKFIQNPLRLVPYLEKSCAEHPDGTRMTLTFGLVSDQAAKDIPFYVDTAWSGRASAVSSLNCGTDNLTFQVTSHTLNSVIPSELVRQQCLLFKMVFVMNYLSASTRP